MATTTKQAPRVITVMDILENIQGAEQSTIKPAFILAAEIRASFAATHSDPRQTNHPTGDVWISPRKRTLNQTPPMN